MMMQTDYQTSFNCWLNLDFFLMSAVWLIQFSIPGWLQLCSKFGIAPGICALENSQSQPSILGLQTQANR
jgi:hypothetical protein